MTSSFHVRRRILWKEVGYLFWVWINSSEDTDVLKRTLGRLKKVMTSYDQTRRRHDVWKKTSDLRSLKDVWFTSSWRRQIYDILKTPDLRRFLDVWLMKLWRRLIYVVWKTSNLGRLENIRFTTSSGHWIYDVKTSDLRRLEDVQFTSSWRCPIYDVLKTSDLWLLKTSVKRRLCCNFAATFMQRRKKWFFLILHCLKYSENFTFCSWG